jgi:hypothetical protein
VRPGSTFTDLLTASITKLYLDDADVILVTDQAISSDQNRHEIEQAVHSLAKRRVRFLVLALGPNPDDADLDMIVRPSCGTWLRLGPDRCGVNDAIRALIRGREKVCWPLLPSVVFPFSSAESESEPEPEPPGISVVCTTPGFAMDKSIGVVAVLSNEAFEAVCTSHGPGAFVLNVAMNDNLWAVPIVVATHASGIAEIALASDTSLADPWGSTATLTFDKKRRALQPSKVMYCFAVSARHAAFTAEDGVELDRLRSICRIMHAAQDEEEARIVQQIKKPA